MLLQHSFRSADVHQLQTPGAAESCKTRSDCFKIHNWKCNISPTAENNNHIVTHKNTASITNNQGL